MAATSHEAMHFTFRAGIPHTLFSKHAAKGTTEDFIDVCSVEVEDKLAELYLCEVASLRCEWRVTVWVAIAKAGITNAQKGELPKHVNAHKKELQHAMMLHLCICGKGSIMCKKLKVALERALVKNVHVGNQINL
jgi:hypothetical protein